MKKRVLQLLQNKRIWSWLIADIVICIVLLVLFLFFEYSVLKMLRYLFLVQGLFAVTYCDWHTMIIPNRYLLILFSIRTGIMAFEWIAFPEMGLSLLISAVLGALIAFVVFGLCFFLARGGMGAGDVKLMVVLGYYFGNGKIMMAMILIVACAAVVGTVQLIAKKKKLKEEIPFAPYVLVGTILTMALGI